MDAEASERRNTVWIALSALAIPLATVGGDLVVRGSLLPRDGLATYALGAMSSFALWGLAMEAARHPRRAVRAMSLAFLGIYAAFGLGLQVVVRTFTHAYLGRRALVLALGIPNLAESSYIVHNAPRILGACLVPAVIVVLFARRRTKRHGFRRRRPGVVALCSALVAVGVVFAPFTAQKLQCLPPDVLLLNGTGGPLLYAMGLENKPKALPVGARETLPSATPAPPDAPSVVLILGESVRRDAVCGARERGCGRSPAVDLAAPSRIGYARAFTQASCTELASATLWSGLPITAPPTTFARAPLVWDWAKARGYRTAYITSQNLLFQQMDLFLRTSRIDLLREARSRDIHAHIDDGSPDEENAREVLAFFEASDAPSFIVVHHANTHAPYRQVQGFTQFPADSPLGRYRNSVAHDDALLGELITKLRATPRGKRAIVIYTSDHGEAWGEHGAYYHSFDLYAEQVDVPLWIDAPEGSLPVESIDRLQREAATRVVSHADVTATVVVLLGALDDPRLRERTSALSGTSLLRDAPGPRDLMMWNCPPMRECATDAFGVLRFPLKLHWVGHEQRHVCSNVEADPGERTPLPLERCAQLAPLLDRTFGRR